MSTQTADSAFAASRAGVSLSLRGVKKSFGERTVIEHLDLSLAAGEFLAILGPSGCGKSTILRMIAGLIAPDHGRVEARPDSAFQTAFVFQDPHLLPWRSVLDNVALPLELMGLAKRERLGLARDALREVKLEGADDLLPAELSGGMRMRASLARALVTRPKLLLLDEPFAALDEMTRFHLDDSLRQSWGKSGMTVVFVTHSISEAAYLANRAVVLTRRGGIIKLDYEIRLPPDRNEQLRTEPSLASEIQLLARAMEEE